MIDLDEIYKDMNRAIDLLENTPVPFDSRNLYTSSSAPPPAPLTLAQLSDLLLTHFLERILQGARQNHDIGVGFLQYGHRVVQRRNEDGRVALFLEMGVGPNRRFQIVHRDQSFYGHQ